MQTSQDMQVNSTRNKIKNTFETTESSKRDTDTEHEQNFKTQRQKYLQERRNHMKQVKKVRKQQFGESSSSSEQEVHKTTPKPTVAREFQVSMQKNIFTVQDRNAQRKPTAFAGSEAFPDQTVQPEETQQQKFRSEHQAYVQQKLARRHHMIEQRKVQFGVSSSQSDEQQTRNIGGIHIKIPQYAQLQQKSKVYSNEHQPLRQHQIQPSMTKSQHQRSPQPVSLKRSMGSENKQKSPLSMQILYNKNQNSIESKKITVLIQSKKNLQWIEETLVIQNKRIKFINQNIQFMIAYISKMKLYFTHVTKDYSKIKITHKNEDFFFAASNYKIVDNVPQYYYVLSRIVQDKLTSIGFQPKRNEAKIFPNYQNLKDAPQYLTSSAIVFGNILKKSQVLGNWQSRFVYITAKQIGSSKKPSDKPTMLIPADSITQLWTRFDIQENNMLNIKIMYNSNTKTQFGIPLSNFTDQHNWLYSFYRIIDKNRP